MKKLVILTSLLFVIAFGGITAVAQCDRASSSPIKCGFYDEGYQDGVADANSNRGSDYRRYRSKFDSQYESFYRQGYNVGYESVRPTVRWTNSQRTAYDAGYVIGQSDRRRAGQNRSSENSAGQYDQTIGLYFQQGYYDGFNNKPRQYDVPLTGTQLPPFPGGGTGTATWSGSVDGRANIVIRGGNMTLQDLTGGLLTTYQNINGVLPRRPSVITATKADGRGEVTVIQQPTRSNDFTAIVQVYDPQRGAGNYRVEMSWATAGGNVEEPYRPGSINWRGRVDGTVNIIISGMDVQSQDITANGLYNVSFDLTGSLARRPGSVTARKRAGSGTVTVIQQPSWDNDFTAIVQVYDPNRGADDYRVEITW